ncbi:esterase family protein [Nocardia huaxiensis]|uniref:Esterase family protein n=2 Tax=Nocardia huaxiensis TaxID=2755382 RepID=A0A7D6ZJ62_9NOCA|nr:esterase family protein [Nocardia huaxiensis]
MAVATVATARAEEGGPAPEIDPRIDRTALVASEARHGDWERIYVASASMRRVVPVDVLRGGGSAPRPTLYLLDGVEAEETSGWLTKGRAAEFFSGKPVDVVITSGGVGSMYTDWQHYDAMLGLNRWETFLTDELPPVVEDYLDSTGRRAIAGVSMGAQGAMMLAQRHPGRYAAVAGLSGCYSTADDFGRAVTRMTVGSRGGDTVNLWGPPGSPEWAAHDSFLGADQLRGTVIHLSAGSGLPSPADLAAIAQAPNIFDAARMAGGGSTLEAGARTCTERFAARLSQLGIPVTVRLETTGMHTWPDFAAALGPAWHTLAGALRVPAD